MENADDEQEIVPVDAITLKGLVLSTGRCPYRDWYTNIRDKPTRQRIDMRLARLRTGNFGDFKPVGGEVFELRLDFGPGYRIYFAKVGEVVVVLLGGGDKSSQQRDIQRAIVLWEENKDDADRLHGDY